MLKTTAGLRILRTTDIVCSRINETSIDQFALLLRCCDDICDHRPKVWNARRVK